MSRYGIYTYQHDKKVEDSYPCDYALIVLNLMIQSAVATTSCCCRDGPQSDHAERLLCITFSADGSYFVCVLVELYDRTISKAGLS